MERTRTMDGVQLPADVLRVFHGYVTPQTSTLCVS